MAWSWYAVVVAVMGAAACSFFFALAESALFALGKWRAQQLAETSGGAGRQVLKLFESPQDLLATLVFGNTVANGAIIGLAAWTLFNSRIPDWVLPLLVFLYLLICCEAIPKTLGVRAPEFWSLRLARMVQLALWITGPLRRIAQVCNETLLKVSIPKTIEKHPEISEEEYQDLLDIAQQQGALSPGEKEMILQIVTLDQRTVGDVMRPRSQIAAIPDDLSREEMVEQARKLKHSRLPVYDETPDTLVGVLNARALLLNPESELEDVIEFASFVPESMNLLQLLKSLQRQRRGMAMVLDEFGGTAGLVTMEDILEQMLGKTKSGARQGFAFERLERGKWRVNGACLLEELRTEIPGIGKVEEVDTVGGLLVHKLEYVPSKGESVVFRGLKLTAHQVDERRVREVLVESVRK